MLASFFFLPLPPPRVWDTRGKRFRMTFEVLSSLAPRRVLPAQKGRRGEKQRESSAASCDDREICGERKGENAGLKKGWNYD